MGRYVQGLVNKYIGDILSLLEHPRVGVKIKSKFANMAVSILSGYSGYGKKNSHMGVPSPYESMKKLGKKERIRVCVTRIGHK